MVAIASLVVGCGGTRGPIETVLAGQVLNGATGEPLPGAAVSVADAGTPYLMATDSTGRFFLRVTLLPRRYSLRIRSIGFNAATRPLEISAEDTIHIGTIRLSYAVVRVEDLVVCATYRTPPPDSLLRRARHDRDEHGDLWTVCP